LTDSVYNGRRAYAICNMDQFFPPIGQELIIQHSGVDWDLARILTGHSPFLSQPSGLAAYIITQVRAFWNGDLSTNLTDIRWDYAETGASASLPIATAKSSLIAPPNVALFLTATMPSDPAAASGAASFSAGTEPANLTALLDLS
jgi:hypothetical protein